jgi:hypothetical protein
LKDDVQLCSVYNKSRPVRTRVRTGTMRYFLVCKHRLESDESSFLNTLSLAHKDKFIVTPNFHVFDTYKQHQGTCLSGQTRFTRSINLSNPGGNR